jgi:hypothetical protein
MRTPALAYAAKVQTDESGLELKWLTPGSGGVGLEGVRTVDGDARGSDAAADIWRQTRMQRRKAENHARQKNGIVHREGIVERVLVEPVSGVVHRRVPRPGPQIETFDLEGGQHRRSVRPFIADLPADKPDTAAVSPSRSIDG